MTFKPAPVSRWYRLDWQFALDVSRFPVLRPASLVISFTPLVLTAYDAFLNRIFSLPISLWSTWLGAVSFLVSWVIVQIAAPKFVREYRDYGTYSKRKHSHRWIVWEFYNNLSNLHGWRDVVKETESKELSVSFSDIGDESLKEAMTFSPGPDTPGTVKVYPPINWKRDIYLPILCDGKKVVLPMIEDDSKLCAKEKELFWILYTQAVKEKPILRIMFWILIWISALLISCNVIQNIVRVVRHLVGI